MNIFKSIFKKKEEHSKDIVDNMESFAEVAIGLQKHYAEVLDYSKDSIVFLDDNILQRYYEDMDFNEPDNRVITHFCLAFGAYLGKTLLLNGLSDAGFKWVREEGRNPFLLNEESKVELDPVIEIYGRIMEGETIYCVKDFFRNALYENCGIGTPIKREVMEFILTDD